MVVAIFRSLEHLDRGRWHDGGDCMLIDELRMPVTAQKHAKIVEPSHKALQLYAVDQEYCHRGFALTNMVQEGILQILRFFASHELNLTVIAPFFAAQSSYEGVVGVAALGECSTFCSAAPSGGNGLSEIIMDEFVKSPSFLRP
jgi:hypothetical protein